MYANICFLIAIVCFMIDGLGICPSWRMMSWGSAAFTAGFLAWEVITAEKQKQHDKDVAALREKRGATDTTAD